jgi:hypothetical protein
MTLHRALNWMLTAFALGLFLALLVLGSLLDSQYASPDQKYAVEQILIENRRDLAARELCRQERGYDALAVWDTDGGLHCVTNRGETYPGNAMRAQLASVGR